MPTTKGSQIQPSGDAKAPSSSSSALKNSPLSVAALPAVNQDSVVGSADDRLSQDLAVVSCLPLLDKPDGAHTAAPHRGDFQPLMDSYFDMLSPRAQRVASLQVMQLLSDVPNCAAAMTRFFSHVDLNRFDHSVQAAAKVKSLNKYVTEKLSPYELEVLEMCALLHDLGHRRGSHALDRAKASHPAAPDIKSWGWGQEFHEYHTARMVGTKTGIKVALGELHPDVLAVLCHADNRIEKAEKTLNAFVKNFGAVESKLTPDQRIRLRELTANVENARSSFDKDFGSFAPTLPRERIALIAELVEKVLDRNSCLELDYMRGGLAGGYVKAVHGLVEKFEKALTIHNGRLHVRVDNRKGAESRDGWISSSDLRLYVSCRQLFREVVATTPGSCSVDVFLREAIFKGLQDKGFGMTARDTRGFEFLRNHFLRGEYHNVIGKDVLEMLTQAPHDSSLLSIEDVVAPLVTMTKDDFTETTKFIAVTRDEAFSVCGVARADMTVFEYELRRFLIDNKVKGDISVIITNDFEKILLYQVLYPDYTVEEVPLLAVHSSNKAVKVVIAGRAVDENGQPVSLADAQAQVERFCRTRSYLKKECLNAYDRHIFVRPVYPAQVLEQVNRILSNKLENTEHPDRQDSHVSISTLHLQLILAHLGGSDKNPAFALFAPEVRDRIRDLKPKWEEMGLHGLRKSDV